MSSELPLLDPALAEEQLAALEGEMAERVEQGRPFREDAALFDRLCRLGSASRQGFPYRVYLGLFSPDLQARVPPGLAPSARDRKAARYLAEDVPLAWVLRTAAVARSSDRERRRRHRGARNCPPALLAALHTAAVEIGTPEEEIEPWTGVTHLLFGSYDEHRARCQEGPSLAMARKHLGDLRDLDMAEVGAGSGPCLPDFRRALGPEGELYAVELDPFALHLLARLNREQRIRAVQGGLDDVRLPERSVDWIAMIGVHLGAGLRDNYQATTLPWLRSMARALRPGGILTVDDGDRQILEQGAVPKIEAAGFTKIDLLSPGQHPGGPDYWLAVFRVDGPPGAVPGRGGPPGQE